MILRGDPPPSAPHGIKETGGPAQMVERVRASLPGKEIRFGKPRWTTGGLCERQIFTDGAETGFAVDTGLLDYSAAETEPEEWRLLLVANEKTPAVIAGLRSGDLVALVAPRRVKP